jgi:hypothetical protein
MATKIVTKNSSTASAVPTASDLVQGELAVNVADKRLFTEDNGGSIVELGTNPSTIDINAGSIDGTAIGASSASTGAFTTLTASGAFTSVGIDDNATSTAITIDSSENVGIGTTSADEALEVSGDVKSSGGNFGIYHFGETSDVTKIVGRDSGHGSFPNTMDFFTNSAQRMRIDSSGNVGIGTTTVGQFDSTNVGLTVDSGNAYSGIAMTDGATTSTLAQGFSTTYLYNQANGSMLFGTNNTERMRINSSGNVGIGTTSPSETLHMFKATYPIFKIESTSYNGTLGIDTGNGNLVLNNVSNAGLLFNTNNTERARIDASGNLLVGKTVTSEATVGHTLGNTGYGYATANSGICYSFNRLSSDGEILRFRKDTSTVGSISTYGGNRIAVGNGDTNLAFLATSDAIIPAYQTSNRDNAIDLGHSSVRFDDIYATNGTIQTSDRNEKQDIAELSDAEQRVAVACKGLMRKFRWKDSVAEKGDDARIHFGIIAQDLQAAFEAEGLDAGDYAMFISTTWWEQDVEVPAVEAVDAVYETQTDEEGNETQVLVQEAVEAVDAYIRADTFETAEEAPEGATEKTRLGVRYSELLAFIISAI